MVATCCHFDAGIFKIFEHQIQKNIGLILIKIAFGCFLSNALVKISLHLEKNSLENLRLFNISWVSLFEILLI